MKLSRRNFLCLLAAGTLALCPVSCSSVPSSGAANEKDLLLHLALEEGGGTALADTAGNMPEATLNYLYTNAIYMPAQEPQWKSGVSGSALLMDGTSTFASYDAAALDAPESGFSALTVSVWFAPRTFEWDDPSLQTIANQTDVLTGLVSWNNKATGQGFLLGYQRFGRPSFQAGIGGKWYELWAPEGTNLTRYAWNYLAATFDGTAGQLCLYWNGELVASRTVPAGSTIAPSTQPLTIGRNVEGERLAAGYRNVCSGLLDEVKLWSCVRTAEQIAAEFAATDVPEITYEDIRLQNLLTEDVTRPQFHAGPWQFWMNEPHAPFYYNGKYHLFYQQNMSGSYWRNICWGHWVSDDMAEWTPIKEAIVPTEGSVVPDGVWSGCAALDKNGVPLLFFTAGNDSFASVDGLVSNQNIGVAYPADLTDPELTEWEIYNNLAVIQQEGQGRAGEFRDPSIWQDENGWNMLICSGSSESEGGTALLYTSQTLELLPDGTIEMDWQYRGPIFEMENQSMTYGTSWELPILLPVSNESKSITKNVFIFSPAPASIADNKIYYFLGDYDAETGKFTPEERFGGLPQLFDYGPNVFTGPSAFVGPDGEVYLFSIMQDQRSAPVQGASGWAHTAGIARRIWLTDDGSDLCIAPADAVRGLEKEMLLNENDLTLEEANAKLASLDGDMLHLELELDVSGCTEVQLQVKSDAEYKKDGTTLACQPQTGTIYGSTLNKGEDASARYVSGPLKIENETLSLEVYIDRSLVEGFFNKRKAISLRAYPEDTASMAIRLVSDGVVQVKSLHAASMRSIFEGK